MTEEGIGGESHGRAGILHNELRDRLVELALDDEGRGAGGDRLWGKVVTVRLQSGDADEERPWSHAPSVVGQVGDVGRGRVRGARGVHGVGQELKVDGAGFYQGAFSPPWVLIAEKPLFCTDILTLYEPPAHISAIGWNWREARGGPG